jgi:hypothetical protein
MGKYAGQQSGLKYWPNFLAGLAFGGSPQTADELSWVVKKDKQFKWIYPSTGSSVSMLNDIWYLSPTEKIWDALRKSKYLGGDLVQVVISYT